MVSVCIIVALLLKFANAKGINLSDSSRLMYVCVQGLVSDSSSSKNTKQFT